MSIEQSDAEAAAVAVAPRVSLADIEAAIAGEYYMTGDHFIAGHLGPGMDANTKRDAELARPLTICLMVMKNGYTVIGKSAPVSPANFNVALGRKFAREDCIRQLWPLLGYHLRSQLAGK